MILEGTLEPGRLPGLLRELYAGQRSGLLRLTTADGVRTLAFRDGRPLQATSSLSDEDLGERLVQNGLLAAVDLQRAHHLVASNGQRLERALLDLGALDAAQLAAPVSEHARELLLRAFQSEGDYALDEQPATAWVEGEALELLAGQWVLDTVRRLDDPDVVRYGLGDLERLLTLTSEPRLRMQTLKLDRTDGFVLSRVDGSLSAREIVQLTPLPTEDVLRSLLGLHATGMIEFAAAARPQRARLEGARVPTPAVRVASAKPAVPEPRPPDAPGPRTIDPAVSSRRREVLDIHASLRTCTHYEILGLPRDASEADVKSAYFRQARRFHPDHHDPGLHEVRDKLEAIFIRVGQAYDVLKNTQARLGYDARLPRLPAAVSSPPPAGSAPAAPRGTAPAARPAAPSAPSAPAPPLTPATSIATQVEVALRQAERHMSEQHYWDAIQAIENVLPQAQGRALQRARLLLSKALLKNPHWVRRAEETLQAALKDDPQCLEAYWLLGGVYKERGLRARAASMYRKLVELKPEHEEAAAQLAELAPSLESEPSPDKQGLLKKFFGRK